VPEVRIRVMFYVISDNAREGANRGSRADGGVRPTRQHCRNQSCHTARGWQAKPAAPPESSHPSAVILGLVALFWASSGMLMRGQTPAAPAVAAKTLIMEPVDDMVAPKLSVIMLSIPTGFTAGPHTHPGPVFAYILQGDIENQVEPDPVKTYHPGDFFYEPMMHVHRMLHNLSATEPAKVLVFQVGDTGKAAPAVKTLMQETVPEMTAREARMITLALAPGAVSGPHKHPGPVIAYILKGEIENQVDPDQPKIYRAGDLFYEPPMHVHRLVRNRGTTEPAELLIFQLGEKGQPSVIGAK
jgi:quercetin dioxygenase-like cupin family protein